MCAQRGEIEPGHTQAPAAGIQMLLALCGAAHDRSLLSAQVVERAEDLWKEDEALLPLTDRVDFCAGDFFQPGMHAFSNFRHRVPFAHDPDQECTATQDTYALPFAILNISPCRYLEG